MFQMGWNHQPVIVIFIDSHLTKWYHDWGQVDAGNDGQNGQVEAQSTAYVDGVWYEVKADEGERRVESSSWCSAFPATLA